MDKCMGAGKTVAGLFFFPHTSTVACVVGKRIAAIPVGDRSNTLGLAPIHKVNYD